SRVSRCPCRNHLGPMLLSQVCELIVIDLLRLSADAIVQDVVETSGKIRLVAVRQVSAVRQIHRQDAVSRLQDAEIYRHVGLAAAMRLYIDVLSAKKLFRPVNSQLFSNVDKFASAVPPPSRVTFSIFIGQD